MTHRIGSVLHKRPIGFELYRAAYALAIYCSSLLSCRTCLVYFGRGFAPYMGMSSLQALSVILVGSIGVLLVLVGFVVRGIGWEERRRTRLL